MKRAGTCLRTNTRILQSRLLRQRTIGCTAWSLAALAKAGDHAPDCRLVTSPTPVSGQSQHRRLYVQVLSVTGVSREWTRSGRQTSHKPTSGQLGRGLALLRHVV